MSQILKKSEIVVACMWFSDYWRLGHAFWSLPWESSMWDGRVFLKVRFRIRFTFLYIFFLLAAMELCRIGRVMDLFNSHAFPFNLIPFLCHRTVSYWASVLLLSPRLRVSLGGCTRSWCSWGGASQLPAPQNHWFLLKHAVLCWMVRMMKRNPLKQQSPLLCCPCNVAVEGPWRSRAVMRNFHRFCNLPATNMSFQDLSASPPSLLALPIF